MASLNKDPGLLATILNRLEPLSDDYVLAFGPEGKQFFATPNGYTTNYLPPRMFATLASPHVSKVLWASFGDDADSWFFAFQMDGGQVGIRLGDKAPQALRDYINTISKGSTDALLGSLRAQLGKDESFVVWSKTAWACYNVPEALRKRLCELSTGTRACNGFTMGSFKDTTITNVAWHQDGACFLKTKNNQVGWIFKTDIMHNAWDKLWSTVGVPGPSHEQVADLACVAIDPYAPKSTTFALIEKQQHGYAPFILHFADEPVYFRLLKDERRLQAHNATPSGCFRWAISKRFGRPHLDSWEVEVKKGEKMKVWREMGQGWFLVEVKKGIRGYCHGSWLDFDNNNLQEDPGSAWGRFLKGIIAMVKSAPIKEFPSITDFVGQCTVAGCGSTELLPGVCSHNLAVMLRSSGRYSVEFLKTERLIWHPDRFAQFCLPEYADGLKSQAEQLFKLYGVLLEQEKKRAGEGERGSGMF